MMARFPKNQRGFSLVELLIVVSIIGVLATVGVPTFRRMIQKSRKTEAKTNLGGLYTSEQAFLAEFGSFGNNVSGLGFQIEGANQRYAVGFFPNAASCWGVGNPIPAASILPGSGTPVGTTIVSVNPAYYTPPAANPALSVMGRNPMSPALQLAQCTPVAPPAATNYTWVAIDATAGGGVAYPGSYTPFSTNGTPTMNAFIAGAIGVIAPGIDMTNPAAVDRDVWVIDNNRRLANVQDGVR